MKRLFSIFLALCTLLSMAACTYIPDTPDLPDEPIGDDWHVWGLYDFYVVGDVQIALLKVYDSESHLIGYDIFADGDTRGSQMGQMRLSDGGYTYEDYDPMSEFDVEDCNGDGKADIGLPVKDGNVLWYMHTENDHYGVDFIYSAPEPVEEFDLPVSEVPELLPDVLDVRRFDYGDMPTFASINELSMYALWNFLWGRSEFECYLTRELAPDEGSGHVALSKACKNTWTYFLFSAYNEYNMYTEDRGDDEGVYAKVTLIFEKPEWDLEARAEALEYVINNPPPEGGFTDYEAEREYAKGIHDFLSYKVTYDPRGYSPDGLSGADRYEDKQEAYTVLGEDQDSTVCAGYARGFALIAHYAGINVAWVWGNETDTESHAWNVLYPCDGSEPVLIDVTWDDKDDGLIEIGYDWFYIPLSEVNDHTADPVFDDFLTYLQTHENAMG